MTIHNNNKWAQKELEEFKLLILEKRTKVMDELEESRKRADEARDNNSVNAIYSSHMADASTDQEEMEKSYYWMDRENKFLQYLNRSLEMIKEGTFGKFDTGAAFKGNGLTINDRNQSQGGDYKNIAHIGEDGKITIWDKNIKKESKLIQSLKKISQLIGYCEIVPGATGGDASRKGRLSELYRPMADKKLKSVMISKKSDIWYAFKKFFVKRSSH